MDLLTVMEIVQLRLVSKTWNQAVINYSRLQRRLKNIQICLDDEKRVAEFTRYVTCLPFSSFYFDNYLKHSSELEIFMRVSGKLVTSLKINEINERISNFQFTFLNSLPSIKNLYITRFGSATRNGEGFSSYWRVPKNCMGNLESFGYSYPGSLLSPGFLYEDYTQITKLTLGGSDRKESLVGLVNFLKKRVQENNPKTLEIEFYKKCELMYIFNPCKIDEFWNCVLSLQGRIKLYNVHDEDISYLRFVSEEGKISPDELTILLDSIEDVDWISDDDDDEY